MCSYTISTPQYCVSKQEWCLFLSWFICPLYFSFYFLLALEWSCFINKTSILRLSLFMGSFLSAYKHTQAFLIKKKKVLSILLSIPLFNLVYPSLLNYLKETSSHTGITSSLFNSQVIGVWLMPLLYLWSCSLKLIKGLLVGESNN